MSRRWIRGRIRLTSSGSSALTFRPGLARSGKIHCLLGFAKTFPEDDEVSLLGTGCTGVGGVEWDAEREESDGRATGREVVLLRAGRIASTNDAVDGWEWIREVDGIL